MVVKSPGAKSGWLLPHCFVVGSLSNIFAFGSIYEEYLLGTEKEPLYSISMQRIARIHDRAFVLTAGTDAAVGLD